jgi:hypothetical protein
MVSVCNSRFFCSYFYFYFIRIYHYSVIIIFIIIKHIQIIVGFNSIVARELGDSKQNNITQNSKSESDRCRLMCFTAKIKIAIFMGAQPDWITFQTSKEFSKISPSFIWAYSHSISYSRTLNFLFGYNFILTVSLQIKNQIYFIYNIFLYFLFT